MGKNKDLIKLLFLSAAGVVLFLMGRVTLFYEFQKLRAPVKVVSDSNVQLPVLEIIEKPPGIVRGQINKKEARVLYGDFFQEVNEGGQFEIP